MIRLKELDENGLVKPRYDWGNSGNGITYTVVAMCLFPEYYNPKIILCWDDKLGVLKRTPDNKYGQQSHDDYTAVAIYCLMHNEKWARMIIWCALKRLGFMQNDFVEDKAFWKSQMFRFPQVWVIMLSAAFPNSIVKFIASKILQVILATQKVNVQNASGVQLSFLVSHACRLLGSDRPMKKLLSAIGSSSLSLSEVMRPYYDIGHSMIDGYKEYEQAFFKQAK